MGDVAPHATGEAGFIGKTRSKVDQAKSLFIKLVEEEKAGVVIKVDRTPGDMFRIENSEAEGISMLETPELNGKSA